MRAVRACVGALTAAVLGAGLAVLPAAPALAEEVYARPADGVFQVEGRGWGHGHGLNQWGAEGAARQGVTYTKILDHYYAGTTQATQANRTIRVLISEDDHSDLVVRATSELALRDRATGTRHALPAGPTRYRIVQTSSGQRVDEYVSGTWRAWTDAGRTYWTGPLQFENSVPTRLYFADGSAREYRGALRAVKTGTTTINVVNVLDLESYLLGVVPRESPASFKAEALKAQSVAARSYSTYKLDHVSSTATYDICSTTMCQVYGGVRLVTSGGSVYELEQPATTAAVTATRGVVRTYGGKAIFAEFSSSNGGWSTQGSFSYLSPKADPWDKVASPHHYWTATLTAAQLERKYPAVGRLLRIRVTRRDGNGDWGGRVKEVVLEGVSSTGAATKVTTTGGGVYSAHTWPASSTGLRGSWWHIKTPYTASIVAKSATPSLVRPPGASTGTLAVHYKNTGSVAWAVSGLHLAVASPAGAADPLANGSTRPGKFIRNVTRAGATSIEPGEAARFEVPLDAEGMDPGTYVQSYQLRIGSGAVFGPVVSWSVPVARPKFTSAAPVLVAPATTTAASSDGAPPAVRSDGTVVVPRTGSLALQVKVKNTGNINWPLNGAVQLATSGARGRSSASYGTGWKSASVVSSATAVDGVSGATVVKPGQTAVFPLRLHGNGLRAGTTREAFEVKYAGWAWLAGSATTLKVVRVDPAVSRLAEKTYQPKAMTLLSYPGDRRELVVWLRNVGGSSWPVAGGEVVATSDGRDDALRTSAWLSPKRATRLYRNISRPGATAVYPGEIAEYRIPVDPTNKAAATYGEWFRAMVASSGVRYGDTVGAAVTVKDAVLAASVVKNTAGLSVPAGGAATYTVDLKNTGNTTWRVGSAVRLSVPAGSGAAHASWLSPTRPSAVDANVTRAGASTVRPGEVARFTFTVAANGRAPGRYTETFGAGWEAWRSTGLRIPVSYVIV